MPKLYWPFPTSTVSEWPGGYYGIRVGVHKGTDFAISQGTPLRATADGTIVIYNGNTGGWGVDIRTDDGWTIRNWHLSAFNVVNGQRVKVGDIIGLTGGAKGHPGAGNSTGPHLHWELRTNSGWGDSGWVDPRTLNPQPIMFGSEPTEPSNEKDDQMAFNRVRDPRTGTVNFADEMGAEGQHIYMSPDIGGDEWNEAIAKVFGPWQELSAREYDIAMALVQRRNNAWVNQIADVVAKKTGQVSVDTNAIAKAVADAVVAKGVEVDAASIAKAVEASLQDEFAKIPDAVANEEADRLKA